MKTLFLSIGSGGRDAPVEHSLPLVGLGRGAQQVVVRYYVPSRRTLVCSILEIGPACVLVSACSSSLPLTGTPSLSVGEWSGTTSQGMPIAFTVSSDEIVTTINLGYSFNGCSGSHTFLDVNVRTAPDVTCIPGPCSGALVSYRAFGYANGSVGGGPVTQVNGLFLPRNEARGQVAFFDYPGCGSATAVEWTATKR
jgi:hypothetical protein